jgi:hypothetical protein
LVLTLQGKMLWFGKCFIKLTAVPAVPPTVVDNRPMPNTDEFSWEIQYACVSNYYKFKLLTGLNAFSLLLQTLYESSLAFGMRKALQTEQGKGEMAARIEQLETNERDLERQVSWAAFASGRCNRITSIQEVWTL